MSGRDRQDEPRPRGGGRDGRPARHAGGQRASSGGTGRSGRGSNGRGGSEKRAGESGNRPEGADRGRGSGRERPRAGDPKTAPRAAKRVADPPVDEDVTGRELDEEVRGELNALPAGSAATVARHLVMAQRLLDDEPERAYEHAMAARRRAGRIGVVREAAGVAAYRAGKYSEALAELRAARRMTGSAEYLPMMADSERGLGRPRRALDLSHDPAVIGLDTAGRIEMLIVAAGARRDLNEHEAAAVSLQVPELRSRSREGWVVRLRYAYADALLAAGREKEALRWFVRAAEADVDGETDAAERAAELGADQAD